MDRLRHTNEHLDREAFSGAVEALLQARCIYVLGVRSSASLASSLSYYLHYMFENVRLITTPSTSEVFEQLVRISPQDAVIGISFPRYSTATGKALLSGLPDAELCEKIRSTKLPTYTSRSITDPEALIKEIRLTRQRGWSRDDQEHEPGIRCIAAPIYDYRGNIIAAVSTSGLKQIITPARDEEIAGFVMDAAHSISQRMGYRD